jgi:hypothetical protein
MTVNDDDLEKMLGEVILVYLKVLPQNLSGGIEENHEIHHWSLITI